MIQNLATQEQITQLNSDLQGLKKDWTQITITSGTGYRKVCDLTTYKEIFIMSEHPADYLVYSATIPVKVLKDTTSSASTCLPISTYAGVGSCSVYAGTDGIYVCPINASYKATVYGK